MLTDALLSFQPLGSPLSLVAGAGTDVRATNIIDLLGLGVGVVAPSNGNPIIGNTDTFGQADAMGVGGLRPDLVVTIGTALVTATDATVNVQLQGAQDDGTGNPGAWQTFGESGEITAAQATAGKIIARLPWLPPFPVNLRPRFLSLNFAIPAATTFTAGTIASALVAALRDDPFQNQAARNYTVAGVA
jgi:hypothetical protein